SLHKWCGCRDVLAPADSVLLFRWEESVLDSLASKVGEVFDASLKYSISSVAFSSGLVTDKHGKLIICCVEWTCKALSPIPYICKLKLLSESYDCADLPLQLEIVLKPASTVERAWLVWLKSFHSKGQEWSVAPLARDVNLCSRSAWQ
ncbi:unnamed protein product, partial [Musa textilis]